ncbi:hypothetical protein FEM48_Zijuj01G0045200 [Ziziphus jujuba var. spinosa]|uniref:Rho termination factor-like N-terminal domain-containing protein n=1 Tax=Ziziphus jujuba var. spinosa TaxID=714518 RepID=A0A978VZ59_ZIZJJ|nr:hypothetical protein FEM48_Zijuj01G0045200 [Ziziphus jujuba var. spinosa]
MGLIVFYSHSVFRFPGFSVITKQWKLGNPMFSLRENVIQISYSLLNLAEIADVPSSFQRTDTQLTLSCIGADENRRGIPPKRSSASRRTKKKEENKKSPVDKKLNSSNQEEIIALFRRIQSSISKEEPTNAEEIHSNNSAESILKVLRRSKKQAKGGQNRCFLLSLKSHHSESKNILLTVSGKATNKEEGKVLTKRRGVPKKEPGIQRNPPVTDFKLTRPPSKFVKISPIPSLTAPRGKSIELSSEALPITNGTETDLLKPEEMKLPELKKLAKSRGIRGYSKLKKSELVNLLRS